MQVGGCHICGGTHELGLCMVQDDASNEVNYIGSHNHHGFHQRGPLGFYQRPRWRYYPSNNFKQGGSPYQHHSQGPSHQEKPTNIEELLIQFMQETRSHLKRTDAAIKKLEVKIGQLAESVAETPTETFAINTEMKPKEDCKRRKRKLRKMCVMRKEKKKEINEKKAQQWEKCSQVEVQQKIILQVNIPPHQLIVKEERHEEHEKTLSVIFSLIATISLAIMWKVLPEYMSFMASLAKR
ncbi:hypothetical protein GmHk_09G026294 [Glycine max]|nr:hypothetical protein GmHk_09G026294 [Glycine max]